MERNKKMKMVGQLSPACTFPGWRSQGNPDSYDKVSLSTPEEGTSMQDVRNRDKDPDPDRGSLKDGKHLVANSITKDHHNSWLTEKIRECRKLVGISANKKREDGIV